jgi:hypothetical protein
MVDADTAVLASVERDVLKVERPRDGDVQGIGDHAGAGWRFAGRRLRAELAKLETEIARLAAAVAEGGDLRGLVAAMQQREARRTHLVAELDAHDRQAAVRRDARAIEHAVSAMREALTDWQGMLHGAISEARQALRALLAGRLSFTPQEREGERFYSFEGGAEPSRR